MFNIFKIFKKKEKPITNDELIAAIEDVMDSLSDYCTCRNTERIGENNKCLRCYKPLNPKSGQIYKL